MRLVEASQKPAAEPDSVVRIFETRFFGGVRTDQFSWGRTLARSDLSLAPPKSPVRMRHALIETTVHIFFHCKVCVLFLSKLQGLE